MIKHVMLLSIVLLLGTPVLTQAGVVKHYALTYSEVIASDALVVDIREPWEWEDTGVLPNSELITLDSDFVRQLKALHKPEQNIILVCRTGSRTSKIAGYVAKTFDAKVINVLGGIHRLIAEIEDEGLERSKHLHQIQSK